MDNSKQALTYPRPSSIRNQDGSILLGYVVLALLGLALIVLASQGPAVSDPSFATAAALP